MTAYGPEPPVRLPPNWPQTSPPVRTFQLVPETVFPFQPGGRVPVSKDSESAAGPVNDPGPYPGASQVGAAERLQLATSAVGAAGSEGAGRSIAPPPGT